MVLHCIAATQVGGAEVALERTISCTRKMGWNHAVINLCSINPMAMRFASAGAEVVHMGWARGLAPDLRDVGRLRTIIRGHHAGLAMGWMYHGNAALVMGSLGLMRPPGMIWAIRSGVSSHQRCSTRAIRRLLGMTSRIPERVVFVSERSRHQHAPLGFHRAHATCIPNGYDLDCFKPHARASVVMRDELKLSDAARVVLWVGRWHPDKAPHHAIAAFKIAAKARPDLCLVMVGNGCEANGPAGIAVADMDPSRVRLLGRRDDIPAIMAAADVLLLSSHSEAFPNVVAEAMACGTPCVSTDVGDVAEMIGETGVVVLVGNIQEMAAGLIKVLTEPQSERNLRSISARQRIVDNYSLETMAARYDRLWRAVINERRC